MTNPQLTDYSMVKNSMVKDFRLKEGSRMLTLFLFNIYQKFQLQQPDKEKKQKAFIFEGKKQKCHNLHPKILSYTYKTLKVFFIPKLLELTNEFCKVAGCKTNIQKPVTFLYSNNELSETKRNKKTIPFTTSSQRMKQGTSWWYSGQHSPVNAGDTGLVPHKKGQPWPCTTTTKPALEPLSHTTESACHHC